MRVKSSNLPQRLMVTCAVLTGAAVAVISCTSTAGSIKSKEDNLAGAGFLVRPANTSKRTAMLTRLPPNKFFKSVHGNTVTYVYSDPIVCKCLYVGSQQAYGQYQQAAQQQKIANRAMLAAELYSDDQWNWGEWGPWGPGSPGSFGPGLGW